MKKMRNSTKRMRTYLLTAFLLAALILPSTANKVVFQIQYARSFPFRESATNKIVGRRKGNTVTFSYKEAGWGYSGTGVMKFKKNAVKIKTSGTPGSDYGFISTGGQTFKLKRVSSKKKFAAY